MKEQEIKNAKKYILNGYVGHEDEDDVTDAVYTILTALELRIPTAPDVTKFTKRCPNCKRQLSTSTSLKSMYKHCPRCGQRIKWDDED